MNIIDPHIHLFDLNKGQYDWLKPQNPPFWSDKALIYRNVSQGDLSLRANDNLAGFVHIEAGFDNLRAEREIAWLEQSVSMPFKSIANINLLLPGIEFMQQLNRLLEHPSVVGGRHLFDDQAVALLSSELAVENLVQLAGQQLIFETQISGLDDHAIELLIDVAGRLPQLTIILSHACFCPVEGYVSRWQHNIKRLGGCENIMIKASGWEMVSRDYQLAYVKRVLADLLTAFGVSRIMLGSNFPLCLFSTPYQDLWTFYQQLGIDSQTLNALSYTNAQRVYRFT